VPPRRLILWDVDGTLISSTVGREVFDTAVAELLGRTFAEHGVQMSGKTDPQIAREILTVAGMAASEVDGHLPGLLRSIEAALLAAEARLRATGRVLPGVGEVLAALDGRDDVLQSVLTGNTAANAAVKLAAFGLDRWLDVSVGAYGSDDADRNRLVPVAVARAVAERGFRADVVWVVGDTPNDLACARAGGARCLLVATGRIPRAELDGLGGDVVLDDLSDVGAAVDALLS
jgi:phosphoglycolate phosphatase